MNDVVNGNDKCDENAEIADDDDLNPSEANVLFHLFLFFNEVMSILDWLLLKESSVTDDLPISHCWPE